MRASSSGPMGMLLMIAPLVAVPALAVFGIPQFAPLAASAREEAKDADLLEGAPEFEADLGEPELGQSDAHSAADLFAPLGSEGNGTVPEEDVDETAPRRGGRVERAAVSERERFEKNSDPSQWAPSEAALSGWELEDEAAAPAAAPEMEVPETKAPPATPRGRGLSEESRRRLQTALQETRDETNNVAVPDFGEAAETTPPAEEANPFAEFETSPRRTPGAPQEFADSEPPGRRTDVAPRGRLKQPAAPEEDLPDWAQGLLDNAPPARPTNARTTPAQKIVRRGAVPAPRSAKQPTAPAANESFSWRTAARQLKELGVRKHDFSYLEDRDKFLFSCILQQADNPRVAQRFEAEADELLWAVEDVIGQITTWQAAHRGMARRH